MKPFKTVRNIQPPRSVFDLSYSKTFTCDMGQLIPIMHDEVVPGDFFKIGNSAVARFMPMVAPVLHQIDMYVHYFFVPYRILWDDWEDFITGGEDGADTTALIYWTSPTRTAGYLWDMLGFPLDNAPGLAVPTDFVRRAYNRIYNEYYRAEEIIDPVAETNETILNRCWEKDYFTSALLSQQRGTAPALPISGTSNAQWALSDFVQEAVTVAAGFRNTANDQMQVNNAIGLDNAWDFHNANVVDFADATTFDVADLRLAFQIQKWMERNARSGSRYTEFLKAHFGVSPRDDRLDRPEYIGGSKAPIIISEVLQTSSTDATTPQGNLAGHGIGINHQYCGKYHVQEYGIIMGIMSIMPKPIYQQGLPRQWIKQTKYDFFFPEFVNLSEQPIYNMELYVSGVTGTDNGIFGYQGRYDEMRTKQNIICGLMRSDFDYWHLARIFTTTPTLNQSFLECNPTNTKRIFAAESEPGIVVQFGNIIKAYRPLPVLAEPGLLDHN